MTSPYTLTFVAQIHLWSPSLRHQTPRVSLCNRLHVTTEWTFTDWMNVTGNSPLTGGQCAVSWACARSHLQNRPQAEGHSVSFFLFRLDLTAAAHEEELTFPDDTSFHENYTQNNKQQSHLWIGGPIFNRFDTLALWNTDIPFGFRRHSLIGRRSCSLLQPVDEYVHVAFGVDFNQLEPINLDDAAESVWMWCFFGNTKTEMLPQTCSKVRATLFMISGKTIL